MTQAPDSWTERILARALSSREDFRAAVREVIVHGAALGLRQMTWVDTDFAEWPLDDADLVDALSHWAREPGAHLTWVGHDFERVRRAFPRLTRWRQNFQHMMVCRAPLETAASDTPCMLLADRKVVVRMLDWHHARGWVSHDGREIQRAVEEADAILQRSEDTFAPTILGL